MGCIGEALESYCCLYSLGPPSRRFVGSAREVGVWPNDRNGDDWDRKVPVPSTSLTISLSSGHLRAGGGSRKRIRHAREVSSISDFFPSVSRICFPCSSSQRTVAENRHKIVVAIDGWL